MESANSQQQEAPWTLLSKIPLLKTRRTMPGKEAGKAKPLKQKVRDKEGRMHAQNHVLTY
jgi:hypothetical protein